MAIRKLDRSSYDKKVKREKEAARSRSVVREAERAFRLEKSAGKLSRKRKFTLFSIFLALLVVSGTYNYLEYRKSRNPISMEGEIRVSDIPIEFYNLCSDIELVRKENGAYPETIADLSFSEHLVYTRSEDDAFLLTWDDGKTTLRYDSALDSEELR